jgi:hypothetical protein
VLVVCCTMLVALILVTYTFTIQNAGRTQEILFILPKGTIGKGGRANTHSKITTHEKVLFVEQVLLIFGRGETGE